MDEEERERIASINREMGHQRAQLAKLVRELQSEEALLDRTLKQYGDLERAVGELSTVAAQKRQQIFALKMELEARQRQRVRIKTPPRILASPDPPPVDPRFAEKRGFVRAPFGPHVTFGGLRDLFSGFAVNISDGGLLVATCDAPELGRRFAVEFDIGGVYGMVRCPVEAVWLDESGAPDRAGYRVTEVGLRFLALTPSDQSAVQRFAASYAEAVEGAR